MGYKSTYQELVYKQPPSFAKRVEYRIPKFQKALGRGSTGKVVRAKWIVGGVEKDVALKIVDKAIIKDKAGMVALEIGILKELNHPNIVSFLDTFESKHKYFISLELALGGTLNDWIGIPFMSFDMMREGDVIHCIKQILKGVEYLHSKEIVHRDLKPENILFKTKHPRSQIMIADFGIAARLDHEIDEDGNIGKGFIGSSDLPDQWENELGFAKFVGTLGFTAPEVLLGFTQTEKIDIWSIGNLVYEMICGHSPWADKAPRAHLIDLAKGNFSMGGWAWQGKAGAKDFIRGCLMVDHHHRISATEALAHPWLNGKPKVVVGYSNLLEPCQKNIPKGMSIYHMKAINAALSWSYKPAAYRIKEINPPRPKLIKNKDEGMESAEESEEDKFGTPTTGSIGSKGEVVNVLYK